MTIVDRNARIHKLQAAVISLAVAFFFPIVVPFQTYIANRTMFDFSAGDVAVEAVPIAFGIGIVLFVTLCLSEMLIGRMLHVLVTGVLLCEYLETGLFSVGLPPLDGELRAFQNPFRVLIDSGLLVLVFSVVVLFYKWTKNWCHYISLGVFIMALASLFDVRPAVEARNESSISDGFCPQYDIVMSARFSSERNVIMLILDSFRSTIASKTMRANPDLQKHFPGFVAYENNFSMGELTARGLPGLMTGKFLKSNDSASTYTSSIFGEDSLLLPYVGNGSAVYFSDELLSYGYTNRRLCDYSNYDDNLVKDGPVFFRNSNGIPYVSLYDTVRFRLAPYRNKCAILSDAYFKATDNKANADRYVCTYREDKLYPSLLGRELSSETNGTLAIFHTSAIHGPITRDRNGNRLPEPSQHLEDYEDYSYYVLSQLAMLMDGLRAKGVYEKSFIVFAADHGFIDELMVSGAPKRSGLHHHGADHSILWVKPFGDDSPFSFSNVPTSNCKVSELIKRLSKEELSQKDVSELLRTSDRKFYAKHGSTWYTFGRALFFYEWRYNDSGDVISCENMGVYKAN